MTVFSTSKDHGVNPETAACACVLVDRDTISVINKSSAAEVEAEKRMLLKCSEDLTTDFDFLGDAKLGRCRLKFTSYYSLFIHFISKKLFSYLLLFFRWARFCCCRRSLRFVEQGQDRALFVQLWCHKWKCVRNTHEGARWKQIQRRILSMMIHFG